VVLKEWINENGNELDIKNGELKAIEDWEWIIDKCLIFKYFFVPLRWYLLGLGLF
jgi:hypothetical protein